VTGSSIEHSVETHELPELKIASFDSLFFHRFTLHPYYMPLCCKSKAFSYNLGGESYRGRGQILRKRKLLKINDLIFGGLESYITPKG